jgi:hypothetical protein
MRKASQRPTRRSHSRGHGGLDDGPDDDFTNPDSLAFAATSAFETLRTDLIDIEAFAQVARDAFEGLAGAEPHEKRRAMNKLYSLVFFTARIATEALDRSDELQRQLDAHVVARRARRRAKLASVGALMTTVPTTRTVLCSRRGFSLRARPGSTRRLIPAAPGSPDRWEIPIHAAGSNAFWLDAVQRFMTVAEGMSIAARYTTRPDRSCARTSHGLRRMVP